MRIHLVGFRCHLDRELVFQDGQFILLKGPSGIGKSTILQAIYWCLYSGRYNIYNHTRPEHPCSVTLDLGVLRIHRKKRPERLQVTYHDREYEDKVGQDLINSLFGPEDVWLACCYILQGQRSPLLEANQGDRMRILNKLSFNTDSPDTYLETIGQRLQQAQVTFDAAQKTYTSHRTAFEAEWALFGQQVQLAQLDMTQQLTPEAQTQLTKELGELREKLVQYQREIFNQQKLQGTINALLDERTSLQAKKKALPPLLEAGDVAVKETELRVLNEQLGQAALFEEVKRLQTELAGVQRELDKFPSTLSTNPVTPEDLSRALQAVEQAKAGREICARQGCEYATTAVAERRQQLQTLLAKQPHLRLRHQIKDLEQKLQGLTGPDVTDADFVAAREKVAALQATLTVIPCPHCKGFLRACPGVGGQVQLVTSEQSPATTEQIQTAQTTLNQAYIQRKVTMEREQYRQNIAYLTQQLPPGSAEPLETPLTPAEIQQRQWWVDELSRVQVVTSLPDIGVMRQTLDQQSLAQRKQTLQAQLNRLMGPVEYKLDSPEKLRAKVGALRADLESHRERTAQLNLWQHRLQEVEARLSQLYMETHENPQKQHEETQAEVGRLEAKLAMAQKIQAVTTQQAAFMQRFEGLTAEATQLNQLYARVVHLTKFKELAIELEYKSLQSTVDTINSALIDVVQILFEDPIEVTLSLFRSLKTKDRMKPDAHVEIQYKGSTYTNVNQLSGGEADRVSLALTLALGRLNTCPLLLLDESMASLDAGVKEACIRVLRSQVCGSKTIIVVAHDFIEGRMDSIVDLTPTTTA